MQGSRVRLSAPSPTPRPERPRRATTRAPLFQTKCHGRPGVGHRPKMRQSRGQRGVRRQKSAAGGGALGANLAPLHSIPGVPSLLLCPPPPSSAREDVPPGPRALKGAGIPGHPRLRGHPLTPALPAAYLCYATPAAEPDYPRRLCPAPGAFSPRWPHTERGAGGGREPPPPGLAAEAASRRSQLSSGRHLRVWL